MTQLGLELGVQCTNHYVFYCVRFLFISLNDLVVTVVSFFFPQVFLGIGLIFNPWTRTQIWSIMRTVTMMISRRRIFLVCCI